jgi:hypothetical protein
VTGYPNKMSDVEPISPFPRPDPFDERYDSKADRRAKKKANKSKMIVDSAGLKTLTIVVKAKRKKK